MVELFEKNIITTENKSSKGNQLKWFDGEYWYKADYTGYEGLTEYLVSKMLENSSLRPEEFVSYEPQQIKCGKKTLSGCRSINFLKSGQQLFTWERLFKNEFGKSLYESVYKIEDYESRFDFIVSQMERITGLERLDVYLSKIVTIDAMCLNEDRHMHNLASIYNSDGTFELCPIFDNGAGLLSDTLQDYPLEENVYELIDSVKAKTFTDDFDIQLEISEKKAGGQIFFFFDKNDVEKWLGSVPEGLYSKEIIERMKTVIFDRMRKYDYLMKK